jgi:hypothetical protein
MCQSTTIYSISKKLFDELKNSKNRKEFIIHNRVKDYYTFQNSFIGIEFVLTKDKSEPTKNILKQIFNPTEYLGDFDFENPDIEEMIDFMESGNYFPFLSNKRVTEINEIISEINELELQDKYNATELNENGIYPNEWTNENIEGESNNLNHLIKDFSELKKIITQASIEENYLLICSG